MVEFKNLRIAVIKKHSEAFRSNINKMNDDLVKCLEWEGKQYKGTADQQKTKLIKHFEKCQDKRISEDLAQIDLVEKADDFGKGRELIITVEWKKSYMGGMNPTASTNYGFVGSSIGGCGYCKLSTATAEALNSDLSVLKLLYSKKNKSINKDNRTLLGYGSGDGLIPHFEGGVGVSSHEGICLGVGLKMRCVSDTNTIKPVTLNYKINVYIVSLK